ncbi:DUF927 domain-containing protein [Turicibacter sanguinis]|uniref:DUF927 domain-containing protein n=1 Tax=Turicibacter sanguinis TaxID=154288 RepID=UPI00232FADC0|nr:DUF927 domain-containing protein [Turicibacter sanguinis]MDB8460084.1 DUF927 domain-containing protein [Turicibacter sanguinis]
MTQIKKKSQINPVKAKNIPFPEYVYSRNGVFREEKDQKDNKKIKYIRISDYIDIKEQSLNLESNEHLITLEYAPPGGQAIKERMALGHEISDTAKIGDLAKYGVDIHTYNKTDILKHLQNRKVAVPCLSQHSGLGFSLVQNEMVFKHYQLISLGKEKVSCYNGELNIEPKGSYQAWNRLIKEEVRGYTPLELAVVMGLASATIGFSSKDLSVENLVVNLVNDSSTGKTTACQLAASVFGSPILKDNGLVMSWNSTFNALQNKVAGNTGVIVVFDEASMARNDDFTKVIYSLAEGKETARMQKDGVVKQSKVWNTLIISTGEKSLFEASNNNSGLKVRLIELSHIVWTQSAENSEKIKQIISNHYGFAGPMYAEELLKRGKEDIIEGILHWRNEIRYKLPTSDFTDRIAMKLAVLMLTAEIANDLFQWNFDLDAIGSLLIKNEAEKLRESDLGETAFERLMSYISIKMDHFDVDRQNDPTEYVAATRDLWGKIVYVSVKDSRRFKQPIKEIMINREIIDTILKNLNYESPQVVIRQWKNKGWLNCEQGKTYRKRKINGISANYIVFDTSKLPNEDDFIDVNQLLSNGQVEEALKQNWIFKGDFTFKTSKEIKQQMKKDRRMNEAKYRSS